MKVVNGNPVLDALLVVQLTNGPDGPEASEVCAVEYALRNGLLPIQAWSDCANVVDSYRRGRDHCCNASNPQAEHWRRVFTILDDHGGDAYSMLTLAKIKAHCTEQNYHRYHMSKLQFFGNKWADRGANDAALLQATEMGLPEIHAVIDALESEHKSIVRWIAEATALVNDLAMRDAVPPLDKDQLAAKRAANALRGGRGGTPKALSGYKRPRAPQGLARTMGMAIPNIIVQPVEPMGKYLRLSPDCRDDDSNESSSTCGGTHDAAPICDLPLEQDPSLSSCCAAAEQGGSIDEWPAEIITESTSSSCAATNPDGSIEDWLADIITESELISNLNSCCAAAADDDNLEEYASDGSDPVPSPIAGGPRAERLNAKTSPALASAMGHGDAFQSVPEPSAVVNENVPFIHGGYMLMTGSILWCVKCGASANVGKVSKYLRKACNGKPPNASMRQRRSRLVRGLNPNNCAPLHSRATRVTIRMADSSNEQ